MSRMIVFLSIAVVLFACAAGASWYFQNQQQKTADKDAAKTTEDSPTKLVSDPPPAKEPAPIRPLLRPTPSSDNDRIAQMGASLIAQEEALKGREVQLNLRAKQIDLVHEEVKKEQKKVDEAKKDIKVEMQRLVETLDLLEKRVVEFDKDKAKVAAEKAEFRQAQFETTGVEAKNLKQLSEIYDKMEAPDAAPIIVQMVESSKLDMAVTILSGMGKRQAATVLGEISRQDATIAVQIFDRMRQRKLPAVEGKGN